MLNRLLVAVCIVTSLSLMSNLAVAETVIGKVYGKHTWIAYAKNNGKIYIRKGRTDFATKCSTGFYVKGDIVKDAYGKMYTTNSNVLTGIQRYLVKGKYENYGCR